MADTYTCEDYKVPKLTPVTDPIALKELTVRDYKANYERIGAPLPSSLIERMAVSDLELTAAHRRGYDASPNYERKTKAKKTNLAENAALESLRRDGHKLQVRPKKRVLKKPRGFLNMPGQMMDEKWMLMMGRLKRISEGANQNSDRMGSLSTTTIPVLAKRILETQYAYMFRGQDGRHNPFRTKAGKILSEKDAFRKLRRMLEDICDDSAGYGMGPWFIPK